MTYGHLTESSHTEETAHLRARVCNMIREGKIGAPDSNGCRVWHGKQKKGQPEAKIGGKRVGLLPHLYRAWHDSPPPAGKTITRSCHNTSCVAPDHLACEIYSARPEDAATRERLQTHAARTRVTVGQVRSQRTTSMRTIRTPYISGPQMERAHERHIEKYTQDSESYCPSCHRLVATCHRTGCDSESPSRGLGHTGIAASRPVDQKLWKTRQIKNHARYKRD